MSETAVSYAFEQLEPSDPLPRDARERVLAQATVEAEQIRERAREEGLAEGRAAGRQEGLSETATAAQAFAEAVRSLQEIRVEVAEAVERDAVELALALAEKVLAGALQARPELVSEVVQGALRRINDRRRITLLVNPGDLELVRAAIGEVRERAGGIELCEVIADPRVALGGAIVRTAEGEVDAGVQTQLERAREVACAELRAAASGEDA